MTLCVQHRVGYRVLCLYHSQRNLPSRTVACDAEQDDSPSCQEHAFLVLTPECDACLTGGSTDGQGEAADRGGHYCTAVC